MHIDTDVLENLRTQLVIKWAQSREFVPTWALLFRGVALEIEGTLNAHTAAQWGLADALTVRRAAMSALIALKSFEVRGRVGDVAWAPAYEAEYAVLRQLAGIESEWEEPELEE
jgi:hypothetical protein